MKKTTQTIKLEASVSDANLWKEKANAIGMNRQDYLLSLLKTKDRRLPPSVTSTFPKNLSRSVNG